jgi:hypothetical protein
MDEIDRIIHLLDFEIDRLRSEARQPGWTKWALIGGVGTCGWLFLSELSDKAVSWPNVVVVFLVASIVWDMCQFLIAVLGISEEARSSETRVILSKTLLGRRRFSALFDLVRVCVLLSIGSKVLPSGFVRLCFCLWYGTFAVTLLFGVFISFFEFPLPAGRAKTNLPTIVFGVVLFGCGLVSIFGIAQKLSVLERLPSVYEWRTAVLIFAIVTLVGFLVRTEGEPLLHSLVVIRQDLGLGKINIESAKEQIDVALAGLTIDQMFHKDVSEILGYLSSVNAEMDEVSKEYAMIEEKKAAGQGLVENENTVIEALKRSCRNRLESIEKTIDLVHNRMAKMNKKMWSVRLLAPLSEEKVQEVAKKVSKGVKSVKGKIDNLKQRFKTKSKEDEGESSEA